MGCRIDGRLVTSSFEELKEVRPMKGKDPSETLIVSNLSYFTAEDVLLKTFKTCINAQVITDKDTGDSKGYEHHRV